LTVVVDGRVRNGRTFVATDDLAGHFLGVRLPADAAAADRIELRASDGQRIRCHIWSKPTIWPRFAFRAWSSRSHCFGVFVTLALVFAILALRRRRRLVRLVRRSHCRTSRLAHPLLGTSDRAGRSTSCCIAALQTLVFAALIGFALTFVRRVELPRGVVRLAWHSSCSMVRFTFGVDVLLDYWFVPIPLVDLAITG